MDLINIAEKGFFYNLIKINNITDDDYNMLNNFNNQDMGIYMS